MAFTINDPYLNPLLVTLVSMFEHAHADTVYAVHVLNYKLKAETRQKIEQLVNERHPQSSLTFLDLSDEQWEQVPAVGGSYGKETNYRLLLPELVPKMERLIYLDVDILVLSDLTELFNFDMNGQATLFVCDAFDNFMAMERTAGLASFFNFDLKFNAKMVMIQAGVLLIDLNIWRKLNWAEEGLKILNTAPPRLLQFPDQAVLNYLTLRDEQYGVTLPWVYNAHPCATHLGVNGRLVVNSQSYTKFSLGEFVSNDEWRKRDDVQILHFSGSSPWHIQNSHIPFRDLYQTYAEKIGWKLPSPSSPWVKLAVVKRNIKNWMVSSGKKVQATLILGFLLGLVVSGLLVLIF